MAHAGGRPTKFKDRYIKDIIDHGKAGGSLLSFAVSIGVAEDTVHQWAKVNPEFSVSCDIVNSINKMKWMAKAEALSDGAPGSSPMVKFMLSAAYGMREKTDVVSTTTVNLTTSASDIIKSVNATDTTDQG